MSVQLNKLFSRRQIGLWIFLGVALVIVILLAVFISPWASSSPDGLEKVAEEKGFGKKAETDKPAWEHSPMKDYAIPGIKSENTSTGISGLIGVVITLGLMLAVAMLAVGLGRLKRRKATVTPTDET
jgi:cobalt/nickel transport protein